MAFILVVEDDPEISALILMMLRVEGHEMQHARDGRQALQFVLERAPDLILMDVMMPHLSSYEAARALQENPQTRYIPIIFVTAKSEMEDRVHGLETAIDYVCKPFAAPELVARVHAALRIGKLQEELRASNARLAQLATTDSLTGLCNRRRFYNELENEMQRAQRYGHPLAVVVFDLDFFKNVNDSWGHAQGDRVLEAFARVLENARRRVDTVARLGGEEFVALLPETASDGALAFAEKVRLATEQMGIACRTFDGEEALEIHITVSAGAAVFKPDDAPQLSKNETPALGSTEKSAHETSQNTPSQACAEQTAPRETPATLDEAISRETRNEARVTSASDSVLRRLARLPESTTESASKNLATEAPNFERDAKLSPLSQEVMRIADRLLYRSKTTGRNRITLEAMGHSTSHGDAPEDNLISEAARL